MKYFVISSLFFSWVQMVTGNEMYAIYTFLMLITVILACIFEVIER